MKGNVTVVAINPRESLLNITSNHKPLQTYSNNTSIIIDDSWLLHTLSVAAELSVGIGHGLRMAGVTNFLLAWLNIDFWGSLIWAQKPNEFSKNLS